MRFSTGSIWRSNRMRSMPSSAPTARARPLWLMSSWAARAMRQVRDTVLFDGTDLLPLKMHERARLGLTLAWQEPARFEGVTVREYLSLGKPDCDPEPALRQVGLSPDRYLNRRVDKALSGGERHRIELASVLSMKPKLAILDEPSAGIDMLSINHIIDIIRALKDSRRIGPLDHAPGRGRAHRRSGVAALRRAHHFLRQSARSRRSLPRADLRSL